MKCTNCQSEWTQPANKSVSKCPFCQADILQMLNEQAEVLSTEVILANMLQAYSTDLLQNPQRLTAMIADLFAHDHKTKRLLLLSVRENIPTQLAALVRTDNADRSTRVLAIQHRLAEDAFLKEEAAEQIVSIWTCALGWENEDAIDTVTYIDGNVYKTERIGNQVWMAVADIDGNVYKTVRIGNQVWMAENLKVSRYRNGDAIPNVTVDGEWGKLTTGAWCNHDNDPTYDSKYGKLYNWYAVDDKRGFAPKGWHVPSREEWDVLIKFLGGKDVAGSKLKEVGNGSWLQKNDNATNKSGFSALECGYRYSDGAGRFGGGPCSYWWSRSRSGYSIYWDRFREPGGSGVHRDVYFRQDGLSVRCIRDL